MHNASEIEVLASQLLSLVKREPAPPLNDAFDRFLRELLASPRHAASTKEWRSRYVGYLRPMCGERPVTDSFRDVGLEVYRTWPETTASMVCNTLATVLVKAVKWKMRREPHDLEGLTNVRSKRHDRVLELEERTRLSASIDELDEQPYGSGQRGGVLPGATNAIRLLTLTGLRSSEVASLRWENLRNHSAWLPESKVGPRWVPFGRDAWALVHSWRRISPWCCPGRSIDAHVSTLCVWSTLQRAAKLAGIDKLRVHDLRHTWATLAVLAGVPDRLIAQALGWTSERMLKFYAHLRAHDVRQACDVVSLHIKGDL